MGRPVGRNLEEEMIVKIKRLFDKVLDSVNKENPNHCFDFEQFVDSFDENDHFTKRVFEFLVKETAQRYRASHPQSQLPPMPRPSVIHHYLQETLVEDNSGDNNSNTNNNNDGNNNNTNNSNQSSSPLSNESSGAVLQQLQQNARLLSPSTSSPSLASGGNHGVYPATTHFGALRSLLASHHSRRRHVQRMLNDEHYAQQYRFSNLTPFNGPAPTTSDFLGMFDSSHPSGMSYPWAENQQQHATTDATTSDHQGGNTGGIQLPTTPVVRPRPRRPLQRSNAIVIRPFMRNLENSMENFGGSGDHGFTSFGGAAEALMDYRPSNLSDMSSTAARIIGPTLNERRLVRLAQASEILRAARAQSQPPSLPQAQATSQQQQQEGSSSAQHQQHSSLSSPLTAHSTPSTPPSRVSRPTAEDIQAPQARTPYDNSQSLTSSALAHTAATTGSTETRVASTIASPHLSAAYEEFSISTARERAALRESLVAAAEEADSIAAASPDLHVDTPGMEDQQPNHLPGIGLTIPASATGDGSFLSGRRRRRTRAEAIRIGSPDIASDNSSAIISQATQQSSTNSGNATSTATTNSNDPTLMETPTACSTGSESIIVPPPASTSSSNTPSSMSTLAIPSSLHSEIGSVRQYHESNFTPDPRSGETGEENITATTTLQTATDVTPAISVQQAEDSETSLGRRTNNSDHRVEEDDQGGEGDARLDLIPPTPPSPNPNGNPMPTFRDRRRSSINPADIMALAQQLQASAEASSALSRHRLPEEVEEEEEEREDEEMVMVMETGPMNSAEESMAMTVDDSGAVLATEDDPLAQMQGSANDNHSHGESSTDPQECSSTSSTVPAPAGERGNRSIPRPSTCG
ncbi:hypothetical protein BGW42_001581 [Actinomortierella wolfii]|nr:hypothetical protein BGW42_001581 [Actinomortierella wolfii]